MIEKNEIIKVTVSEELLIPEDLPDDVKTIDADDYASEYSITYEVEGKEEYSFYDLKLEAGCGKLGNITDIIKSDIPHCFEEITDYEIFDVNDNNMGYSTAKIRVKAVA